MSEETDQYKIPAYQRKRSLAAKSRKTNNRIKTATRPSTIAKTVEELSIPNQEQNELFEKELEKLREMKKRELKSVREMKICGHCDGYFDKINVAVIRVTSAFRTGDRLVFEKTNGLFEQTLESMQKNRKDIAIARSGDDIGTKVAMEPKVGTPVYKVIE